MKIVLDVCSLYLNLHYPRCQYTYIHFSPSTNAKTELLHPLFGGFHYDAPFAGVQNQMYQSPFYEIRQYFIFTSFVNQASSKTYNH